MFVSQGGSIPCPSTGQLITKHISKSLVPISPFKYSTQSNILFHILSCGMCSKYACLCLAIQSRQSTMFPPLLDPQPPAPVREDCKGQRYNRKKEDRVKGMTKGILRPRGLACHVTAELRNKTNNREGVKVSSCTCMTLLISVNCV